MKLVHRITGFGHHEVSDSVQTGITATYGNEGTFSVLALSYGEVRGDGSHLHGADVHNYLLSPITLAYLQATMEAILADYEAADRQRYRRALSEARAAIVTDPEPATWAHEMLEYERLIRHVEALKSTMPDIGDDLDLLVRAAARVHAALHGGEGGSADDPDDRDTADTQEHEAFMGDHGPAPADPADIPAGCDPTH